VSIPGFAKSRYRHHLGSMLYLLAASLLWAFSFGLIKGQLGGLDPGFVALCRLALAAAAFLPVARPSLRNGRVPAWALGLGVLQFGLMYVLYIAAYAYLPAWMVALFTVLTPLYVALLAPLRGRRLSGLTWPAVGLTIIGAAVVLARGLPQGADWRGILLLQGANLCFAAGQIWYPEVRRREGLADGSVLFWMYLGAAAVPALWLLLPGGGQWTWPAGDQLWVLLYLGLAPTGLGFYLWNKGSARVSAGLLAGANNLKVPLAVLVSWLVFGEQADYWRVSLGLALVVTALFMAGGGRKNKG
jgi:drug/metabolite transporter (DMT)-like permease